MGLARYAHDYLIDIEAGAVPPIGGTAGNSELEFLEREKRAIEREIRELKKRNEIEFDR